jgi:peroxiredoxin
MILLGIVMILALIWFMMPGGGNQNTASTAETGESGGLIEPEDFLPQNLREGDRPEAEFTDVQGKKYQLSAYRGQPVVLICFASWCSYCHEQLESAAELGNAAQKYGAKVILIDRYNTQKEKAENAVAEQQELAPDWDLLFDRDEKIYHQWGLQLIPTMIFLDSNGYVRKCAADVQSAEDFAGYLDATVNGRTAAPEKFLKNRMTAKDGGIYTNIRNGSDVPDGKDVLSESQGLIMLSAVYENDQQTFDMAWNYVRNHLMKNGLPPWYIQADGTPAQMDAALDDLRIWEALNLAGDKWGGYEEQKALAENIYQNLTENGKLVDYYDQENHSKAETLSLPYADISLLAGMEKEKSGFKAVSENALRTVQKGYISDSFPLYYSSYDYAAGKYSDDDLNMAEALYTLWNLSKAGQLRKESLQWLRTQVENGTLAARYHVDGTVVSGYAYHSTACYAIAALIAQNEQDKELYSTCTYRMEQMRVWNVSSTCYGGFGTEESSDFPSFDQLMPLLLYTFTEQNSGS